MSAFVKAQIAAEVALLTRITDTPVEPFGYGTDISVDSDMDPDARDVRGDTTLVLAQAIVRRLDCPRGALPGDDNYGIDLRSYANRGTTTSEILSLAGQIRTELGKDDRIDTTAVIVRPENNAQKLRIEIAVRPIGQAVGGFSLTLAATSSTVLIEEIAGG